jgi:hypothetical protein
MKPFKDTEGREWLVSINVNAIKRVRGLLNIDLYKLLDDGYKGLSDLLSSPIELVDVLYVLCQEKAEERGITDEQFGRAMAGDALQHAADAFLEELTDFFPDPRVRAGLKKVIEAGKRVRDKLMDHAEALLDDVNPEAEAEKLIASSTYVPASSESIPVPSRSENSP